MSVKKNFIYNSLYQFLAIIIPLISTPYIARVIGAEGVGIYSYSYSIANYFVIFAMLGINNYGNRSIARVRDDKEKLDKTFSSILFFHIIISTISVIVYLLFINIGVTENKDIFYIQALYVISAIFDINWFFFGIEKFKLTVIRNTIIKLTSMLSIFILVKQQSDLWKYTLIFALGILISQCSLWILLKKYVSVKRVSFKEIFSHLKPCSLLFIPVIAISIYKIMDKIMLGYISDMIQVGFYENSEKLLNVPMGLITALGTVMLPKMSNIFANGKNEESSKYIFKSMKFVMFISIGATCGLISIADILVPIFLGEEFNQCILVIKVISPSILFLGWANVIRTQYLIPTNKDKVFLMSTLLGAIINVILNIIFIKKYGAVGVAIGTVFAEATVAIYQTFKVRKYLPIIEYFKSTVAYFIPASAMYVSVVILGNIIGVSIGTIILQVIVGGTIYCSLTLFIMLNKRDEDVINILNKYGNVNRLYRRLRGNSKSKDI